MTIAPCGEALKKIQVADPVQDKSTISYVIERKSGATIDRILAVEDQVRELRSGLLATHEKAGCMRNEAADVVVREALKAADASWRASFANLRRDLDMLRQINSTLDLNCNKLENEHRNTKQILSIVERRLHEIAPITANQPKFQGEAKFPMCEAESIDN